MSNFINPSVVAAEVLDQLEYELVAASLVYRDQTSDFAAVRGLKVGDAVSIRTVTDYRVDEFSTTISTQEINQSSTQLTIEKHFDTSVTVTSREMALNLDGIRKEIATPVAQALAQEIDEYLLTKIIQSQGLFVSATLGETALDLANIRKQANTQQISKVGRIGLVNDDLEATLLGQDVFTKFDTRGQPGVTALQEADMGRIMGTDWFSTVNFPTAGNGVAADLGTAPQTQGDGAGVTDNTSSTENVQGTQAIISDSTTDTFLAGDKIQIAGVKRAYTVTTDTAATATTIPIDEEISELIPDGAAITVIGDAADVTYQGIVFNQGAFAYAVPPLDAAAGDIASATVTSNGFSIRVTEAYDINTKKTIWSFDMLIGAKAVDPRKSLILGSIP